MNQEEIISGCKKGNEVAFRCLLDTYAEVLMGVCVRYLRDHHHAEDALQDTFIHIFRFIGKYNEQGNFTSWLRKIAVNNCLKTLRNKVQNVSLDLIEMEMIPTLTTSFENMETEDMLAILDKLPDQYRIVYNMYIVEGFTHREIGELLGIEESHSRTILTRAKKYLREKYFFLNEYLKSS